VTGDAAAITFDDGFENTATAAWPCLVAHGLPATVFVVPAHVGGFNDWGGRRDPAVPHLPLLSWDRLGHLADAGATLGAHTMTHANLATLDATAVTEQLDACRDAMRERVGTTPSTFAYPYGGTSATAAALVRERFRVGVTTELRLLGRNEDHGLLPRLDMYYFRGPGALESWGQPSFFARLWTRRIGRQARAWLHPMAGRVA
jgi:peptidoglycan/xylan/chitin deacetylase (PgdA/CDA1 family)